MNDLVQLAATHDPEVVAVVEEAPVAVGRIATDDGETGPADLVADAAASGEDVPVFDDEFPILADEADDLDDEGDAFDPRLTEMHEVLVTLRDREVSDSLRLLRQLFPHIPFPFRVRALMAVRHGAMAG